MFKELQFFKRNLKTPGPTKKEEHIFQSSFAFWLSENEDRI